MRVPSLPLPITPLSRGVTPGRGSLGTPGSAPAEPSPSWTVSSRALGALLARHLLN